MITINKYINTDNINKNNLFQYEKDCEVYKNSIFLDLEHYIYKVPICIGAFGACIYDKKKRQLHLTQYMAENPEDGKIIIKKAYEYLQAYCLNKKYIVTFSGNNDFGVIDYLFKENNINFNARNSYIDIDLQREYQKSTQKGIGLKNLEKIFNIYREGEVINGMTLAKIIKHLNEGTSTLPKETLYEILQYNEQDVVSLFKIIITWNKYIVG